MLLDAAQSTTDNKDRVLFQPIGNKSDGFTSAIVGVREVPQSSKNSFKLSSSNNSNSIRTLCIRSGEVSNPNTIFLFSFHNHCTDMTIMRYGNIAIFGVRLVQLIDGGEVAVVAMLPQDC